MFPFSPSPSSLLFLPAADLPAPLPPPAGSAAAEAQLQREQILSSQRQVSLTPPALSPQLHPIYPSSTLHPPPPPPPTDTTKPQQSQTKSEVVSER